MRIYLVDTETTGVGGDDKVCEVAWMHIDADFNVLAADVSLINPQRNIPHGASAVNGITDVMVQDAPTLAEYIEKAGNPFMHADLLFVAHNAPFDFKFLKDHLHPETRTLDTLRVARVMYPEADNHKQGTLAYTLGLEIDRSKAHSAGGDLDVLLQLLKRMCQDAGCGIEGLMEIANKPRKIAKMTFGKHKGKALAELPKDYVKWLLDLDNLDSDLRASLQGV